MARPSKEDIIAEIKDLAKEIGCLESLVLKANYDELHDQVKQLREAKKALDAQTKEQKEADQAKEKAAKEVTEAKATVAGKSGLFVVEGKSIIAKKSKILLGGDEITVDMINGGKACLDNLIAKGYVTEVK